MTALDPATVGLTGEDREFAWTDRETLLYALGVGCGPDQLAFVTENSHGLVQRVLPTFAVIACDPTPMIARAGRIDWSRLVHGGQWIRLYRPLAAAGRLRVTARISNLQDKGPGRNAVLDVTARGVDPGTGETVAEVGATMVIRGGGGFGGDPGRPAQRVPAPDRASDVTVVEPTTATQPLLYRLSGDRNPLHSDPWYAVERAGFPGPILHGLCTYGVAGRALLDGLCAGEPGRFVSMSCRFSAPAMPGEVLTTSIWRTGPGTAAFVTRAAGPDGAGDRVVLDAGLVEHVSGDE